MYKLSLLVLVLVSANTLAQTPGDATPVDSIVGPNFEEHPSSVELRCFLDDYGDPRATFTWSKDGVVKETGATNVYTIPPYNLTVTEHDGVWTCTPVNSAGSGQPGQIQVIVYAAPERFTPYLILTTAYAEDVDSLNLTCNVSGRPEPSVRWYYEGGDLPDTVMTTPSQIIDGKLTLVAETLTWTDLSTLEERRFTNGTYNCTGRVEDQTMVSNTKLQVYYIPFNVTLSPPGYPLHVYNVTEGTNLTVTCSAVCSPDCSYTWYRDEIVYSSGSELSFSPAELDDQDEYECAISNGEGGYGNVTAIVIVETGARLPGAAKAGVGPYFETQTLDVNLKCALEDYGSPAATFAWTKDGELRASGADAIYTIPAGQLSVDEHDGLWQCTPSNSLGSSEPGEMILTVNAGPDILFPPTSLFVFVDADNIESFNVSCKVSGRPEPSVTWSYYGGELPTVVVTSRSGSTVGKLTEIMETMSWSESSSYEERLQTGGPYTCTARVDDRYEISEVQVIVDGYETTQAP